MSLESGPRRAQLHPRDFVVPGVGARVSCPLAVILEGADRPHTLQRTRRNSPTPLRLSYPFSLTDALLDCGRNATGVLAPHRFLNCPSNSRLHPNASRIHRSQARSKACADAAGEKTGRAVEFRSALGVCRRCSVTLCQPNSAKICEPDASIRPHSHNRILLAHIIVAAPLLQLNFSLRIARM